MLIDPTGTVAHDGFHVNPERMIDFLKEQTGLWNRAVGVINVQNLISHSLACVPIGGCCSRACAICSSTAGVAISVRRAERARYRRINRVLDGDTYSASCKNGNARSS